MSSSSNLTPVMDESGDHLIPPTDEIQGHPQGNPQGTPQGAPQPNTQTPTEAQAHIEAIREEARRAVGAAIEEEIATRQRQQEEERRQQAEQEALLHAPVVEIWDDVDLTTFDREVVKPPAYPLPRLDGKNFREWSSSVKRFLKERGLWGIVDGSVPYSRGKPKESCVWPRYAAFIKQTLYSNATSDQKSRIDELMITRPQRKCTTNSRGCTNKMPDHQSPLPSAG